MGNILIPCVLIYTFIFLNTRLCYCNLNSPNNSTVRCIPSERAALLDFKHNLTHFALEGSLLWDGEECCHWERVVCDNTTGHVTELHLNEFYPLFHMKKLDSLVYLLQLKQLEQLDLSYNNFSYSSIPRFMGSMKQLRYLDLSYNSLSGFIPYELGNLTNLDTLDLFDNMLIGEIPTSFGNLTNLKQLTLSHNNLSSIASSFRFPSNLESLDLSYNQLSGKIPTSLGNLFKLQRLLINYNPLEGTVLSESHFVNLSSLTDLAIDDTLVTLNFSSDWAPPFQLKSLSASHCKINGHIPPWLQTQKNLSYLDLSNTNISGLIPRWFHSMEQLDIVYLFDNNLSGSPIFPINFSHIDISNNSLSGLILSNRSRTDVYHRAQYIVLSYNFLSGPIPESFAHSLCRSTSLFTLDMQNNNITGVIPNCWGKDQPILEAIYLSNNQFTGQIPSSLCQLGSLIALELQNNSLSGPIPNCLAALTSLRFVSLSYNKLTGHIPCFNNTYSNSSPYSGFYLHLNDNMLSGEIPSCLSDLSLRVLDIGGNQLSGAMLKWFSAGKLMELQILRLRGNKFSGRIPKLICSLPQLQLLDFGHNHFTGSIPRCLSNLTAMISLHPFWDSPVDDYSLSDVSEVIQGIERAYTSTLRYLVGIDLSCNNLLGSIPDDITMLSGLLSLNLSYNQLSGTIPENIGGLKSLISLDLSKNKLEGSIPTSMGELYSLSHLNLSYNNLAGQIPTGEQLQTLSDQASIYAGNPRLCGDALPKKCKSKINEQGKGRSDEGKGDKKKKLEKMGFELVVMSGFATGFWGVVGCLVLNKRWRHLVFQRLEDGYNWLYVIVVLKMRTVKAKINRR